MGSTPPQILSAKRWKANKKLVLQEIIKVLFSGKCLKKKKMNRVATGNRSTIGFIQVLGFNPKNKMVNPFHKKEWLLFNLKVEFA